MPTLTALTHFLLLSASRLCNAELGESDKYGGGGSSGAADDDMVKDAVEIHDRDDSLQFNHHAYRVEQSLRDASPTLYKKLIRLMRAADER